MVRSGAITTSRSDLYIFGPLLNISLKGETHPASRLKFASSCVSRNPYVVKASIKVLPLLEAISYL